MSVNCRFDQNASQPFISFPGRSIKSMKVVRSSSRRVARVSICICFQVHALISRVLSESICFSTLNFVCDFNWIWIGDSVRSIVFPVNLFKFLLELDLLKILATFRLFRACWLWFGNFWCFIAVILNLRYYQVLSLINFIFRLFNQ